MIILKKILFIATYGDFLSTFELSNIKICQRLGYEVHCASNFINEKYNLKTYKLHELGIALHEIDFDRSPFSIKNIISYKKLIKLIKNEKIDVIDCHNAVVGVYSRLAAKKCKVKNVIYTPHGFFFYKGAPLKNNTVFKIVEIFFAKWTDLLISINKEDYKATKKMKIRGKSLYVPGVGIDIDEISNKSGNRKKYCNEFNIPIDAFVFFSVGELINRKNHIKAIEAFADANIENSYYIIAGIGELETELKGLIKEMHLEDRIKLIGYRNDVKEIMKSFDVFLFPSYQEGLPVALMESMACGMPSIVSNIRGNIDLIEDEKGGYLFNPNDKEQLKEKMQLMYKNRHSINEFGNRNKKIIEAYDIKNVQKIMLEEYKKMIS